MEETQHSEILAADQPLTVCAPVVQLLGQVGEYTSIQVTYRILDQTGVELGFHGAIFMFRARDLPRYTKGSDLIVVKVPESPID
jgi:hypothetical protein